MNKQMKKKLNELDNVFINLEDMTHGNISEQITKARGILADIISSQLEPLVILQKAGMAGGWEIGNKIKRKCIHCNQHLYSAERKTILHGYERGTICLECETVHPQERFWNGR